MTSFYRIFSFSVLLLLAAARLSAHAFLEHSDPPVGGKVHSSPVAVRIWFTEAIEAAFSSIKVFDVTGKEVDKKDTHSNASNRPLLEVSLPRLGPGTYKVVWRAVSADTHVTNGNFSFEIAQ